MQLWLFKLNSSQLQRCSARLLSTERCLNIYKRNGCSGSRTWFYLQHLQKYSWRINNPSNNRTCTSSVSQSSSFRELAFLTNPHAYLHLRWVYDIPRLQFTAERNMLRHLSCKHISKYKTLLYSCRQSPRVLLHQLHEANIDIFTHTVAWWMCAFCSQKVTITFHVIMKPIIDFHTHTLIHLPAAIWMSTLWLGRRCPKSKSIM